MTNVARGNSTDSVFSLTGTISSTDPVRYGNPVGTSTSECSSDVFVNNIGVVRMGDKVAPHKNYPGGTDGSVITNVSQSTAFANGKLIARKGDQYTADNTITSGSDDTFIKG